ncbi:hypothetical protein [Intestinibacter bartlettii]|uniref:DUF4825 domain-containing protein n=1 Tax=Intestinibacter bartlettii TaxID=261299 RepID=A0ABS6E068_9FIRM|nr:hypothetical protein [Intestinibacter bartlettii]MBU5337492.1 hypothetical protein [Intestinibacter bartlettii]
MKILKSLKKILVLEMIVVLLVGLIGCSQQDQDKEQKNTTLNVKEGVIDYNPVVDAEVTNLINTKLEGEKCNVGFITGEVENNVKYDDKSEGVVTYMIIYGDKNSYYLDENSKINIRHVGDREKILGGLGEEIADIYKERGLGYDIFVDVYVKSGIDYSSTMHYWNSSVE